MTHAEPPSESSQPEARRDFSYELDAAGRTVAHFSSGARINVATGRARAYPGRSNEAPATRAFYNAAPELIQASHVLDAGAGAGVGTRILSSHYPQVTGIDHDPAAIAFARHYAPDARFLQADLCTGIAIDRADGAVLADVLGHMLEPEAALYQLRSCLDRGSRLLIAEPLSYVSQRLAPPARRAFSKQSLAGCLLRNGWEVEHYLCQEGTFLCVIALRSVDAAIEQLAQGWQHARRGAFDAAQRAFEQAERAAQPAVRVEALLGSAELAFAANDGDAAARACFAANEAESNNPRALCGLSRIALAAGAPDDALYLALDAARRDPTEPLAHAMVASAAEQLAHPDALNAWRIAANLAPDAADIAQGLARVATAKGDFDLAIASLGRFRSYAPELGSEFHVTLAWLLLSAGRTSDARIEAKTARAINPADPGLEDLLGALQTPAQ